MKCECIRYTNDDEWVKIEKTAMSMTGSRVIYKDKSRTPILPWASVKAIMNSAPKSYVLANCDECKHQLGCLVDQEYRRWFESKE